MMYHHLIISDFNSLDEAVKSIPVGSILLDLSRNNLHEKTGAELAQAFSIIPVNATSLDLSVNDLYEKTGAELAQAFSGIPVNITSLDLSWSNLLEKTGAELKEAFSGIPVSVTSLNLGENELHLKDGAELALAFSGIPTGVTSLDLSVNDLLEKNGVELKEAFSGIPVSVTSLNLSGNRLGLKNGTDLAEAFFGIPTGVTSLDLSKNYLGQMSPQDLRLMLQAIPEHVTSIILRNNCLFENKTSEEIDIFLKALGTVDFRQRLDLGHNGESEFSRAVGPLAQMSTSGIPVMKEIDEGDILGTPGIYTQKVRVDEFTMPSEVTGHIASYLRNLPEETVFHAIEKPSKAVGARKELYETWMTNWFDIALNSPYGPITKATGDMIKSLNCWASKDSRMLQRGKELGFFSAQEQFLSNRDDSNSQFTL